jgi:glycosyltransferase involved in cell wall biosynthesis
VPQILAAFRAIRRRHPLVRLLLAGAPDRRLDLPDLVDRYGLEHDVFLVERPADELFDELIAASDVALCLRWPTALETSGPWVRALAAGRPTVTIDLAHQADVPAYDPRSWQAYPGRLAAAPGEPASAPVTVALDILDEDHSLRLAMDRLAFDASLRASLGQAARAYWRREHAVARMADDYLRVLPLAAAAPAPAAVLPAGLRADPLRHVQAVLREWGDSACVFN